MDITEQPGQGPPLPTRQIMHQRWRDISFVHWRVDPARVAPLLPRGVRPDLYDGSAWVARVPGQTLGMALTLARTQPLLLQGQAGFSGTGGAQGNGNPHADLSRRDDNDRSTSS